MGQFLAIGIVTEYVTSKINLQKYNITKNDLIAEMIIKLYFEPAIYDFSETDENYFFKLKSNVIENQLISFLEKFYPKVYLGRNQDFVNIIEILKNSEPSTWLKLSEEKSYEEFQLDVYGVPDYLYFNKPFKPHANIYSTSIMLSLEGKIIIEENGRQFNFIKFCIQETFSEFSIAKALRVYITG
jgi:hypothetical protein